MEWEGIIIALIAVIGGGIIVYLRERSILTHDYRHKMVNEWIREFGEDSKRYFKPIALASGDLSGALSKEEILKEKEIPFYYLAKYLYQRELLRNNAFFHFPTEAQEEEVSYMYYKLNVPISEMYENNKRSIAKIIGYYASNKEYNAFYDGLSAVNNEFEIFKSKINDDVFRNKLCNASGDFGKSIVVAITTAYKPWYEQYKKEGIK